MNRSLNFGVPDRTLSRLETMSISHKATNLPSLLVLHQRERELEVGRNPFGYQEFKPLKLGSAVVAFPSVLVLLSEILWLCIK